MKFIIQFRVDDWRIVNRQDELWTTKRILTKKRLFVHLIRMFRNYEYIWCEGRKAIMLQFGAHSKTIMESVRNEKSWLESFPSHLIMPMKNMKPQLTTTPFTTKHGIWGVSTSRPRDWGTPPLDMFLAASVSLPQRIYSKNGKTMQDQQIQE